MESQQIHLFEFYVNEVCDLIPTQQNTVWLHRIAVQWNRVGCAASFRFVHVCVNYRELHCGSTNMIAHSGGSSVSLGGGGGISLCFGQNKWVLPQCSYSGTSL